MEGGPVIYSGSSNICIVSIGSDSEVTLVNGNTIHVCSEGVEKGLNGEIEKEWGNGVSLWDPLFDREGGTQFAINKD